MVAQNAIFTSCLPEKKCHGSRTLRVRLLQRPISACLHIFSGSLIEMFIGWSVHDSNAGVIEQNFPLHTRSGSADQILHEECSKRHRSIVIATMFGFERWNSASHWAATSVIDLAPVIRCVYTWHFFDFLECIAPTIPLQCSAYQCSVSP